MIFRHALLILLAFSASFAAPAGYMVAVVEKEWTIVSNSSGLHDVTLNGSFLTESTYQYIIQANLTEGDLVWQGSEMRLVYHASNITTPKKITATAVVRTSYIPEMGSNPPIGYGNASGSTYTNFTPEMKDFARSQVAGSEGQIDAMVLLLEWVHNNIRYDEALWGSDSPAKEVFSSRESVCVGQAQLMMAFARSLGIETRYVSGYAFSDGWQEHAWAEFLIGDQWIAADPNFREFGYLDARHIIGSYSQDQTGRVDRLKAKGGFFSFEAMVHIQISESSPFPPIASAYAAFDGTEFTTIVSNSQPNYITPTIKISFPSHFHPEDNKVLFISPGGRAALSYNLNTDSLDSEGSYSIPYMIIMQGTDISDTITIQRGSYTAQESSACPVSLILLSTFIFSFARAFRECLLGAFYPWSKVIYALCTDNIIFHFQWPVRLKKNRDLRPALARPDDILKVLKRECGSCRLG
jgi:hypothetical protein